MTALAARTIVRFRHLVIAGWVALAALAVPRAARVADVLSVEVGSVKTARCSIPFRPPSGASR
jgi:uncharacterized membrane protein YdfJ with MMPL/SSD domain